MYPHEYIGLASALGKLGHEVHIVTNGLEVEDEYREEFDLTDPKYQPKNVYIHSTDPSPSIEANPSHIPFSKMYCEKLASKAVEVVEDYNLELIDSRYLVPYSVAGYLAKSLVGVPQIISHAGSDLQRLYPSPSLNCLLEKVLKNADGIITNSSKASFFANLGVPSGKIFIQPQTPVDLQAFNPKVAPFDMTAYITNQNYFQGIPIIAYIGKITHHFETKCLPELLKACSMINEDFLLVLMANGNKIAELKAIVKSENIVEKVLFLPFFPPWMMPSILKSCTCVVNLESASSPTLDYHVPTTPMEAMATGRCVLMSNELHEKEPYNKLEEDKEVLVVNPKDANKIKEKLEMLIRKPSIADAIGINSLKAISQGESIEGYAEKTIQIYRSILNAKKAK